MASDGDHKKQQLRLFGVDLTQHSTNFSRNDHNVVPQLAASASKNTRTAQDPKGRVFRCRYCSKVFQSSKALGGHQNAHRNDRTASKSNPVLNSPPTDGFQYPPVVGQQPSNAIFASSSTASHNFELQRVYLSNYNQPHFEQWPIKLPSNILPCAKRARTGIELVSTSLSAVKGARNEASQNHNTTRARNEDSQKYNTTRARNDIEIVSTSLSSVKRARNQEYQHHNTTRTRNDIEMVSTSLSSVKRARNQDSQHHNTTRATNDIELVSTASVKTARNQESQHHNTTRAINDIESVSTSLSAVKRAINQDSQQHNTTRAGNDIEFVSTCLASVKRDRNQESQHHNTTRARNDIKLPLTSLPLLKGTRNEDPEQYNTTPGLVSVSTKDVELDLSLHL